MVKCNSDAACGRHGVCDDRTDECVCNKWWTGKADMLSYDGYACTNFEILEAAIWGVALFMSINLFIKHIRALRAQARSFKVAKAKAARRGKILRPWSFTPFRLLTIGIFATPILIAICAPKAFLLESRELARSWEVSILFVIAVPYGFIGNFVAEMNSLDTMVKGLSRARPEEAGRLRRYLIVRTGIAVTIYASITAVSVLYGCVLGEADPDESPMRYMLVLRSMGLIVFMQTLGLIARTASAQAQLLLKSLSQTVQSADTSKAQRFLIHFEQMSKEKVKLAKVSTIIYIVFSLPWLWPYQTYPIAIVIIKITGKAHFVNNFLALPPAAKNASVHGPKNSANPFSTFQGSVGTSVKPTSIISSAVDTEDGPP